MEIIELVKNYFKELVQRFPQKMPNDNMALAVEIRRWSAEISQKGIESGRFIEVKEALDKDARFVAQPPTLDDFFAANNLFEKLSDLGNSEYTLRLIEEVRSAHKTFALRYNRRWKTESLEEEVDRLVIWIKDLSLHNVQPETLPKALDWFGTKSDWNRFAPSVPEFIIACRMVTLGEDVPSCKEAHMIILGVTKRKTHPLVEWLRIQVKQYEAKNKNSIPSEVFATLYTDLLMDFSAQGKIPELPKVETQLSNESEGYVDPSEILTIIKNIRQELYND